MIAAFLLLESAFSVQARSYSGIIKVKGRGLHPQHIKFLPIIDHDTLDIIVYVKGVTKDNYMILRMPGFCYGAIFPVNIIL
jgi:hypothetical protein